MLHEDDALLVIDKPAGMAVHGGSGISRGDRAIAVCSILSSSFLSWCIAHIARLPAFCCLLKAGSIAGHA